MGSPSGRLAAVVALISLSLVPAVPAWGAVIPVAEYHFFGDLLPQQASAPAFERVAADSTTLPDALSFQDSATSRMAYYFPLKTGLRLDVSGLLPRDGSNSVIRNQYSIDLAFRYDSIREGDKLIFATKNRTVEDGLYANSDNLILYKPGQAKTSQELAGNSVGFFASYRRLVLTSNLGTVNAFLDGQQVSSVSWPKNLSSDAVQFTEDHYLHLFLDNSNSGNESQPGFVTHFSFFDTALDDTTASQLSGSSLPTQIAGVPEPTTMALLAVNLATLGGFRFLRHRRQVAPAGTQGTSLELLGPFVGVRSAVGRAVPDRMRSAHTQSRAR